VKTKKKKISAGEKTVQYEGYGQVRITTIYTNGAFQE
jgi:hypothetical protein